MIIGVVGFLLSMIFWSSWSPWYRRRATYADDAGYRRGYGRARTTYVEEEDAPPGPPPAGPPPPP